MAGPPVSTRHGNAQSRTNAADNGILFCSGWVRAGGRITTDSATFVVSFCRWDERRAGDRWGRGHNRVRSRSGFWASAQLVRYERLRNFGVARFLVLRRRVPRAFTRKKPVKLVAYPTHQSWIYQRDCFDAGNDRLLLQFRPTDAGNTREGCEIGRASCRERV